MGLAVSRNTVINNLSFAYLVGVTLGVIRERNLDLGEILTCFKSLSYRQLNNQSLFNPQAVLYSSAIVHTLAATVMGANSLCTSLVHIGIRL